MAKKIDKKFANPEANRQKEVERSDSQDSTVMSRRSFLTNLLKGAAAVAVAPRILAGCDESTREEYFNDDFTDLDIGPDSCAGIDIGPDSCAGIDIGPDSCAGIDIGPDSCAGCDLRPFDGEYGCNEGSIAVGVRCGNEYTSVDLCKDDIQSIMDECPNHGTLPLSVHCGDNPQKD